MIQTKYNHLSYNVAILYVFVVFRKCMQIKKYNALFVENLQLSILLRIYLLIFLC